MNDLSEQQQQWVEYWSAYRKFLVGKDPETKWPKASPQAYYDRGFGKTDVKLSAHVGFQSKTITLHVVMQKEKANERFERLKRRKGEFEASFGESLEWRSEAPRDRHIRLTLEADPGAKTDWPRQHQWLYNTMIRFQDTFGEAIREL